MARPKAREGPQAPAWNEFKDRERAFDKVLGRRVQKARQERDAEGQASAPSHTDLPINGPEHAFSEVWRSARVRRRILGSGVSCRTPIGAPPRHDRQSRALSSARFGRLAVDGTQ